MNKSKKLKVKSLKVQELKHWMQIFVAIFLPCGAFAVTTSFWEVRDFKDGKLKDIMLDRDGFASLAPALECVWEGTESYVWTMTEEVRPRVGKTLYVGTGEEGKVYKIESGKTSLLFDTKEAGVFSLTLLGDKIYVGTSPNGKIFVIDKNGNGTLFKETGEKYIWEIVVDENNNLYAATGTNGNIIRIKNETRPQEVRPQSGEEVQPQIDTFYKTNQMNIPFLTYIKPYFYVGTGEDGLCLKITSEGKSFCIYDAEEGEITGVVKIDSLIIISATIDTSGSIYLIYPDNRVERIWQTRSPIKGIQAVGNKIIAAAGKRVYRIGRDGDNELLAELPSNISCIFVGETSQSRNTDIWIGTSEIGKVYKLKHALAKQGTIESPTYDTESISRWGKIEFKVTGEINFKTRTGNTKEPDQTWEEWKEVLSADDKVNSQAARFIQWQAILSSEEAKLKEVKIPFLRQNEKPKISEVKVATGNKMEGQIIGAQYNEPKIIWTAKDANGDSLSFNLYFKLVDEKIWTCLKQDIRENFYPLDPKAFPDGEYEFKVVASDYISNPMENALTSELISLPYLIDNTQPTIEIGELKGTILYFTVKDNQGVKSCEYALDGGEWQMASPIDNLFDSKAEEFKISLGSHLIGKAKKIVIRAQDTYGNIRLKSKSLE